MGKSSAFEHALSKAKGADTSASNVPPDLAGAEPPQEVRWTRGGLAAVVSVDQSNGSKRYLLNLRMQTWRKFLGTGCDWPQCCPFGLENRGGLTCFLVPSKALYR